MYKKYNKSVCTMYFDGKKAVAITVWGKDIKKMEKSIHRVGEYVKIPINKIFKNSIQVNAIEMSGKHSKEQFFSGSDIECAIHQVEVNSSDDFSSSAVFFINNNADKTATTMTKYSNT